MNKQKALAQQKLRRRRRVRKPIRGTVEQPRLSVFRSHKHIYCQVIDDTQGKVLASASTRDKDLRDSVSYGGNRTAASTIGKIIAERAKAVGIEKVCFDRGHYKYHGRVADLADAAREGGLVF